MQEFSSAAFGLALVAAIIYVWLRAVAHNRNAPALARAKSHSFWCALIAFFASTSISDESFWLIAVQESGNEPTGSVGFSVLKPAFWLIVVYLIGLYSWPRELRSVRSASLEARTLATPVPRRLLATVCVIAVLSIASLWPMYFQPGFAAAPSMEINFPGGSMMTDELQGAMAGPVAIRYSALQIIALIAGMALVALVIMRRPPLNGMTHQDNQTLRSVWLNRLLRTGGYLLALALVDNLNFVAASPLDHGTGSQWYMISSIFMVAVSGLMFFWAPGGNFEGEPRRAAYYAFGRARDHLLTMGFVATTTALLSVYLSQVAVEFSSDDGNEWTGQVVGERATDIMITLLIGVLAYMFITTGLTFYGHLMAGKARQLPRLARRLPVYIYCIASIAGAGGIFLLFAPPHEPRVVLKIAGAWETTAVVAALIAMAAAGIWWARHCAVPWKLSTAEEIWYRQVLELRILRTSCSALLLMPGWAYDLGPVIVAIGLIIFCMPSMVVLTRPSTSIPHRQPA